MKYAVVNNDKISFKDSLSLGSLLITKEGKSVTRSSVTIFNFCFVLKEKDRVVHLNMKIKLQIRAINEYPLFSFELYVQHVFQCALLSKREGGSSTVDIFKH